MEERNAPVTDLDAWEGLGEEEVSLSRAEYGENRLSRQKRKSFLRQFLASFGDPMIKILLVALAINIIFLFGKSNWFESLGIAFAILLATFVSTLCEYGSESAFEKLQEEASRINCRVKRAGGLMEIPVERVVVGDVVLLQAGDRVPADGIMLSGRLDVDQSSLNGESKEAKKRPAKPGNMGFAEPGLLFSSSVVCAGEGLMRVTSVGDGTVYGRIGAEIQQETRESPLVLRLGELAAWIGRLGYVAALFSALAFLFNVVAMDNRFDPAAIARTLASPDIMLGYAVRAATLAVTVIVMAVPEGLPMMITVVLSANMRRMLKDNVLVRKLMGIETAGSLNILFTDKTGTLTRGRLQTTHFVSGAGREWANDAVDSIPGKLLGVLRDAVYYNCSSSISGGGSGAAIGGNATDRAALEFARRFGEVAGDVRRGNVTPFSSDLKYMATTVSGRWNATFVKGAPEKILPRCTGYYTDDGEVSPEFNREIMETAVRKLAGQAVRVIAVAVEPGGAPGGGDFKDLKLVGLLGIRDDIRPEAADGVRAVQSAGIQTVMITGDARPTALAIAREIGLSRGNGEVIMTSAEMNALSDRELGELLPRLRVVARAMPSDKSRLVRLAQAKGLVVGMTGDGVNDAPALKQADVGFAMGSGAEIAKEAGDIVVLDDNFGSIARAICYGRTIFKSIRKFIIYQMSICMCAVGVSVVGPLIGVESPITVIQMLWINIVMDTLAGLAFSGEIARRKYMEEPPKARDEPIINAYMAGQIAVNSVYTTILCLFFLKSGAMMRIFGVHGQVYIMTAFFALFMFSAIFTSFCARTHEMDLTDYLAANKPFLWIMGGVTVIQTLIIYFGGPVFRTVCLAPGHMLIVVLLALTVIPVDTARKYVLNRGEGYAGT